VDDGPDEGGSMMAARRVRAALLALVAGLLALPSAPVAAAQPRFLTLPFDDARGMRIQDGWLRWDDDVHAGIDYVRGRVDRSWTWTRFPVLAAARGKACAALDGEDGCINGVGTRVVVKHRIEGRTVYTYYGHLETVSPRIPVGTDSYSVWVRRGEFLGWAGHSGNPPSVIHLHFQVVLPPFVSLDPYDIYDHRGAYPNPAGTNGMACGPEPLWIDCPPRPPDRTWEVPAGARSDVTRSRGPTRGPRGGPTRS
jgi:murein DD-endopeptidase MepM/ murein hydrolase activator NlpD